MSESPKCKTCGVNDVSRAGDECGDCKDVKRTNRLVDDLAKKARTTGRKGSAGRGKDFKKDDGKGRRGKR